MIKLATVFSGIGAIEHALDRMGLEHEIVFACDNGDVDILSKKIDDNLDIMEEEIKSLKEIIRTNIEKEDEFSKQLKQCENKCKQVIKIIKNIEVNDLNEKLLKILEKSLNEKTKSTKRREYEGMIKAIKASDKRSKNYKFEQIKISLKILNDFSKDNNLNRIDETKITSKDGLDWIAIIEEIAFVKDIA